MPNSKVNKNNSPLNIALAYQGFVDEPVPSEMFDAVVSGSVNKLLKVVQALSLFLAGALIMAIVLQIFETNTGDDEIRVQLNKHELAVSSHATFAKDVVYPVHVGVKDFEHLGNWLSYRIGRGLEIPLLDDIGYRLLGGNVVPDGDRISASLIYEDKQDKRVSLFFRNFDGYDRSFATEGGTLELFNWLSWNSGQNQLVLVSELEKGEHQKIFEALKKYN